MEIDFRKKLTEEEIIYIKGLDKKQLLALKQKCAAEIIICDTNQQNRKILINSLYGALTLIEEILSAL